MSDTEQIELKVELSKRIRYFADSSFGIYSFTPLESGHGIPLSDWGNFVATGSVPEMFEGKEYDIIVEPSTHAKYGKGYNIVMVKHKPLTSAGEQMEYIRIMLKESQYEAIKERYPDEKVIDLIRDDKFDWQSVKGIGEKTYAKIKNYLLQNLDIQEALVELRDLKLTFKAMKKLVMHFGSAAVVVQKVKDNIYTLTIADGFGFKKIDEYALARGDSKTNQNRITSCIEYILAQEENSGHSWITRDGLISKAQEILQIESHYINDAIMVHRTNKKSNLYITDDIVALEKNYFYEKRIKELLYEIWEGENYFKVDDIEERIKAVEESQGFTFTDEQKEVIHMAVEHNVLIVNGKAGTGKTTALKGSLGVLADYIHNCCALSGKAAKIITANGLNGSTIHRMMKIDPSTGKFVFNNMERLPIDIVVIDESSMVNSYLFYSILNAIKKGGKVIIQGDSEQLPAIGCGSVFYDLLQAKIFPQKELTVVQRQAKLSGILSTANYIRDGKQINGSNNFDRKVYGELKDFHLFPLENKEYIQDTVLDICKKYKGKDFYEFQVLTGLKERGDLSARELNYELQKIFNDVSKPYIERKKYKYREGDKIIQCGNNYNCGENGDIDIFNGTIGIIEYIHDDTVNGKKYIGIKFEGIEETIEYVNEEIDNIEMAYAITVHRSQGSTIKHVLFAFDYSSYMLLSRQFVYTGITRSSKGCVMVCENRALTHAIRTNHSGNRNTFLYSMLMG